MSPTFFFLETHAEENHDEDGSDSVCPASYTKTCELCEEDEEALPYIEQFEKDVQDEIIHFGNSSLEQVSVEDNKSLHCLTGLFFAH